MGTLTFGSMARMSDYQSRIAPTATKGQSKATPISPISSQIPTGKVDSRTDQALIWSGLKTPTAKSGSAQSSLFEGLNASSQANNASTYSAPDLELGYSFSSIKKILAYRDSLQALNLEGTGPIDDIEPEKTS